MQTSQRRTALKNEQKARRKESAERNKALRNRYTAFSKEMRITTNDILRSLKLLRRKVRVKG